MILTRLTRLLARIQFVPKSTWFTTGVDSAIISAIQRSARFVNLSERITLRGMNKKNEGECMKKPCTARTGRLPSQKPVVDLVSDNRMSFPIRLENDVISSHRRFPCERQPAATTVTGSIFSMSFLFHFFLPLSSCFFFTPIRLIT